MIPPEDPDRPVTVLRASDPAMLAVVSSLLEQAGIEYFVVGEAVGALCPGPVGPFMPEIRVAAADAEQARELLEEFN